MAFRPTSTFRGTLENIINGQPNKKWKKSRNVSSWIPKISRSFLDQLGWEKKSLKSNSSRTRWGNTRLSRQGGPGTTLSLNSELIPPTWAVAWEPSTQFRLLSGGCQLLPPTSQLLCCWLHSFQVSTPLVRRGQETLTSAPCLGGHVRL